MKIIKKRIAFLGHGLYYGGATTSLYLLIKSLDQNLYEIFLYVPTVRSEEMKKDFKKYCSKIRIIPINQIRNAATCSTPINKFEKYKNEDQNALINCLLEDKVELIHINTTVFSHLYHWIKEYTTIKIVTHVREMLLKYGAGEVQKYIIENISSYSDALICISDNEKKYFPNHSNVHVIANPFDFEKNKTETTYRIDNNIDNNTVLVGMLGQFEKAKGQDIFLKMAINIIEADNFKTPMKFVIIGVNKFTPYWKVIIKKFLGREDYSHRVRLILKNKILKEKVILIPYSYKIINFLKALDIIVRPARTKDPWGRDIIESMALEKPIVATGTSGFFIDDGKTGYLVDDSNPELLAEKVQALIFDPILRKEMGQKGLQKIKELCDFSANSKVIENIYHNLLS